LHSQSQLKYIYIIRNVLKQKKTAKQQAVLVFLLKKHKKHINQLRLSHRVPKRKGIGWHPQKNRLKAFLMSCQF